MARSAAAGGTRIVRTRHDADAAALGALLLRDRPRTGYPYVPPSDATAWVAPSTDLAAFVAEDDGVVVGHVALAAATTVDHGTGTALQHAWAQAHSRPPEQCAVISRLFVSADHQRHGLGARLLDRAVGWSQGRGLAPCLDILPLPDDAVLRWYRGLGWRTVGEFRAHWHQPEWPSLVAMALPAD